MKSSTDGTPDGMTLLAHLLLAKPPRAAKGRRAEKR
ncbi:protein of unknown function (plasmid) [Azospirillum baldaniorum]|uniref:Uncharacterized protein n=1 Tax=Azospirillum baldaniorum TaxID=1064539 RepID=A0A9P1JYN5_9PROT|nr:protein of unknown function [Azospirillum baldaniorum]